MGDFTLPTITDALNNAIQTAQRTQDNQALIEQHKAQTAALIQQTLMRQQTMKQQVAAAQQQQDMMKQEAASQAKPAAATPADSIDAATSQASALDKSAADFGKLSQIWSVANPSLAVNYARQATEATRAAADIRAKAQDQSIKMVKTIGDIAGNVTDQTTLDGALSQLEALNPKAAQSVLSSIDRDPITGAPMATPKTLGVMKQLSQSTLTAADRAREQNYFATQAMRAKAEEDRKQEAQARLKLAERKAAQAQGGASDTDPSMIVSMGAQLATGEPLTQIVPGWGNSPPVVKLRNAVRAAAYAQIRSENPGMSDAEVGKTLAQRTIDFVASKTSTSQLDKMTGATRQAVAQLNFNATKAQEEMKGLTSSNLSPIINAIARGAEYWSGDPRYSGLFFYMAATAQESARILSSGQMSAAQLHQGAADEAKKWASINMTPAMFNESVKAMEKEGNKRLSTYIEAKKAQAVGNPGEAGFSPSKTPAASAPQVGAVQDGYKFKGGDPADKNKWVKM